jgi:hypothetical protein
MGLQSAKARNTWLVPWFAGTISSHPSGISHVQRAYRFRGRMVKKFLKPLQRFLMIRWSSVAR